MHIKYLPIPDSFKHEHLKAQRPSRDTDAAVSVLMSA